MNKTRIDCVGAFHCYALELLLTRSLIQPFLPSGKSAANGDKFLYKPNPHAARINYPTQYRRKTVLEGELKRILAVPYLPENCFHFWAIAESRAFVDQARPSILPLRPRKVSLQMTATFSLTQLPLVPSKQS